MLRVTGKLEIMQMGEKLDNNHYLLAFRVFVSHEKQKKDTVLPNTTGLILLLGTILLRYCSILRCIKGTTVYVTGISQFLV